MHNIAHHMHNIATTCTTLHNHMHFMKHLHEAFAWRICIEAFLIWIVIFTIPGTSQYTEQFLASAEEYGFLQLDLHRTKNTSQLSLITKAQTAGWQCFLPFPAMSCSHCTLCVQAQQGQQEVHHPYKSLPKALTQSPLLGLRSRCDLNSQEFVCFFCPLTSKFDPAHIGQRRKLRLTRTGTQSRTANRLAT